MTIMQGTWHVELAELFSNIPADAISHVVALDPEHVVDDNEPGNDEHFPRKAFCWELARMHQPRRLEDIAFYTWKCMVWGRVNNREINVFCGQLKIANYEDYQLHSPYACAFQPERRLVALVKDLKKQQAGAWNAGSSPPRSS